MYPVWTPLIPICSSKIAENLNNEIQVPTKLAATTAVCIQASAYKAACIMT